MRDGVNPAIVELLEWISSRPRTYVQAMEAWQSTCPRHTVWEDALIDGLIQIEGDAMREFLVTLTERGRAVLAERVRRSSALRDMRR